MDSRRAQRTVSDPKVRQVGFFTAGPTPERSQSVPPEPIPAAANPSSSPPMTDHSPSGNSLSPVVMIPPRRHSSEVVIHSRNTATLPVVPGSPLRRESITAGSYNPSEFFASSMSPTSSKAIGKGDFDNGMPSPGRSGRGGAGKVASSFPRGGFDLTAMKASGVPASELTTVSKVNDPTGLSEKGGAKSKNNKSNSSKPLKEKTTKAERRAMQEAQRAAKAAAKSEGGRAPPAASGPVSSASVKPTKAKPPQKSDNASVAASEKKGGDRLPDNRKKDVPQPRMQYDDESRVEKAKRRSVVKQTEVRNRVELFRHLPQYEHGNQLPDLEAKFFQLDPMHPSVYKVGLQYLSGDISGGNARCITMLQAFQDVIRDYSVPPEKALARDLTAKINSFVSFLIECRPLSISMGNAIRFLKSRIAELPLNMSESEAKASLQSDIERFINEKIILANKVIVSHAVTKIRDGDVLLTYGSPCAVENILLHAHESGKQFRVVVVDSRPKLEGQLLLQRLVKKGLSCTYTHINAVSYIMHEVSRVFLGASSVLANGTVYSRVGTACVAMVAHAFGVPVLVCCEAYKFHERVQLDSICSNELGNPDTISKVIGREDINYLDGLSDNGKLQLLNLIYDATPSDYVSMIVTDYGMVPPTSVPVIVREYRREQLWV